MSMLAFRVRWKQPLPVNSVLPASRLTFDIPLGGLIKKSDAAFLNAEQVETKALMLAGTASEGDMFVVYADPVEANNGYYEYKNGAFVPTVYPNNLLTAFKTQAIDNAADYTDQEVLALAAAADTDATNKANAAQSAAINAAKSYTNLNATPTTVYKKLNGRAEVQLDTAGILRVISTTAINGELQSFNPQIAVNTTDIKNLGASVNGISAYKKLSGLVQAIVDSNGVMRIVSSTTTGDLINYGAAKQKTLVAGDGVNLLETPENITISTGATAYATPTEFVLCLIAGQSNASYYGGDAALAPSMPNLVCRVWDNTYSVLRDINDGTAAATTCKQTFAPALALEFYKQTGMGLIVVNSAVGSTAQVAAADNGAGNWDTTGTLRQLAVDRFNACKTYLNTNNVCYQSGFIAWAQGEQDGLKIVDNTITKAQYKSALNTLISFFKTSIGSKLPFVIVRTAYRSPDNIGYQSVRAAQVEVAAETAGAYMGYTGTYRFVSTPELMSDSVHYNQSGKNLIGTALGKITSKLSAGVN